MCTVEASNCRFSNTALIHVSFVKKKKKIPNKKKTKKKNQEEEIKEIIWMPCKVLYARVNKKQKIALLFCKTQAFHDFSYLCRISSLYLFLAWADFIVRMTLGRLFFFGLLGSTVRHSRVL